jgi:hypothetical protein
MRMSMGLGGFWVFGASGHETEDQLRREVPPGFLPFPFASLVVLSCTHSFTFVQEYIQPII